jgi:hypothetical protein
VNPIRRSAVIAVTSGVAVASLALPTTALAKAPKSPKTHDASAAAAGFLARSLVGKHHDHFTGSYVSDGKTVTYVNYGETADAILSMDAAGVAQAAAKRATTYLEAHAGAYAGTSGDTYSPGAIGKLLLVAEAQHVKVTDFGGVDLVNALQATEGARGAAVGEYQQNAAGTPEDFLYFSTVGQALPVLALASAGSAAQSDAAAVSFLEGQQCPDGGYPSPLQSDAATACQAGGDVDSTAYAAQALLAVGSPAATASLEWLRTHQHSNGSLGRPGNANSTAIAIEAFVAGKNKAARAKARKWLVSRQLGCSVKASGRGAVAFAAKKNALSANELPTTVLATSQAGVALAGLSLAQVDKKGSHRAAPRLKC